MIRILFVSSIRLGDSSATGKTLEHIFSGLENVSIMQYCINPVLYNDSYCMYPTVYANKKDSIINYFIFKYHSSNTSENLGSSQKAIKFKSLISQKLKQTLLLLQDLSPNKVSKYTLNDIAQFQPDVIYTLGGGIAISRLALFFSKYFDIPIVVHSMDDHLHTKYKKKTILNRYARGKYRRIALKVFSRSICGIAIGPKMKTEYEMEFGVPHYSAMNCVDSLHILHKSTNKDSKTIIFSGGLHGGRDKVIIELAKRLQPLSDQYNLEVFTNKKGQEALSSVSYPNLMVSGYVPENEIFENLARADFLLHVESTDSKEVEYFRLSMSTKIPEYLSTGIPVLAIGSNTIATIDYLEQNRAALCVENVDQAVQLLTNIGDYNLDTISANEIELVEHNHITKVVQQEIKNAFITSVKKYKKRED